MANELLKEKIRYLYELDRAETERQKFIENKMLQYMGLYSVIFAILSISIPIIINAFVDGNIIKIILIFAIVLCLICVGYALIFVFSFLNVKKFKYMFGDPENTQNEYNNTDDFLLIEKKDLEKSILNNTETNNNKATLLMKSSRWFFIGITGLLVNTAIVIMISAFQIKTTNKVHIENQLNIEEINNKLSDVANELEKINNANTLNSGCDKIKKDRYKSNRKHKFQK